jgi:branched-chain amino acid transport system ATP-binding protein
MSDATRAAEATPVLELRGVRAAYGNIEALHGIDLVVPGGSVLAVLGPNGAGKTTVRMEGLDVTGASAEQLSRAGVCLIPEGRGVFPNLTVRENVLMDTFAAIGRRLEDLEGRTYERFPRLGERRHQLAGTLSGGEQQMLSLARALTTDPALILLDELSMGLAPIVVSQLFEVVRELAAGGVTIVVVEQFAGVIEFVDEVAILVQGRIRGLGDPKDMAEKLTRAYLGMSA